MTSCTEFEYTFKMYSFEVANCLKTREQIRKDSHGTTFGVQRGGRMKTTGGEHPVWRCGAIPRPPPAAEAGVVPSWLLAFTRPIALSWVTPLN